MGPGVIEAFYAGLETVALDEFDYLCKLDLDLDLPPRYFELLMARMEANPRLGTTSGKPYFTHPRTGALVPEVCGDEMSVGMTKFYRTDCFREIGGFVREVMWDGIDCHRCRMLGWIAESVDDAGAAVPAPPPHGIEPEGHLDRAGALGLRPVLHGDVAALHARQSRSSGCRSTPCSTAASAMLWGYLSSAVRRVPRYEMPGFRPFLRRYQHACLRARQARGHAAAERGAGDGLARGARAPGLRRGVACQWTVESSCSGAPSTAVTMQAAAGPVSRVVPRPTRAAHRDHDERGARCA